MPLVPKGRQETQHEQFMSPLRGLLVVLGHSTTGLHPWLQHTVPSGLTCLRPDPSKLNACFEYLVDDILNRYDEDLKRSPSAKIGFAVPQHD